MNKKEEKKILRIGIIQGGKILEERLIRKKGDISIGYSPKCTLILPLEKIPLSYSLFLERKGRYFLRFTKGMIGKVSINEEIYELRTLRESGLAKSKGEYYFLPLDEKSRGKLIFGAITLLFQFVTPPPAVPKLQLPASAKGAWIKQIDYPFLITCLISFFIQAGSIGGLDYWWRNVGQFQAKEFKKADFSAYQMLKTEIEIVKKEEIISKEGAGEGEEKGEGEAGGGEEDKEDLSKKKFRRPAAAGVEDKEARYKRQLAKVTNQTILKYIASSAEGDDGIIGATVKNGATASKLVDAWNSSGGVRIAQEGEGTAGYRGGPKLAAGAGNTYARLEAGDIKGEIKTGDVKGPEKGTELAIKVRIGGALGEQTGPGKIDKAEVANVFRRRLTAIRYCYEKQLKLNQNLEGKITIRFTIGPAGRITTISVVENSTGDSSIGSCIVSKVQTWRFSPPEEGSVTFSYPFILSKG